MVAIWERIKQIQALADERLQAWVIAGHCADLIQQPSIKGPVMVHHVPLPAAAPQRAKPKWRYWYSMDWLSINGCGSGEHLIATQQPFTFDENTAFAWLPTVTSVSRQALFPD